jgi:hypothetical protein
VAGLKITRKSQRFTDIIIHDANDVAISGNIPSQLPDMMDAMKAMQNGSQAIVHENLVKDSDGVHRFHIHRVRTSFDD